MSLEYISIDLSNYCSKMCPFCYNNSTAHGETWWTTQEIIDLALDCAQNGVKAISLGGGEPFEYDGIFEVIAALTPAMFVSVTSNGLPLLDAGIFNLLRINQPHKIHLTVHHPENKPEVIRIMKQLTEIRALGIKAGINLLVSAHKLPDARHAASYFFRKGLLDDEIIFVPRKFTEIPSPKQLAWVAGKSKFQSTACLNECKPSQRFCSVSWNKHISYCSFSSAKMPLKSNTYKGMLQALEQISFKTCIV